MRDLTRAGYAVEHRAGSLVRWAQTAQVNAGPFRNAAHGARAITGSAQEPKALVGSVNSDPRKMADVAVICRPAYRYGLFANGADDFPLG